MNGQSTEANSVPEKSQQRPSFYDAEGSSFPGLKEGQKYRITVAIAVTAVRPADRTSRSTPQLRSVGAQLLSSWLVLAARYQQLQLIS
ncbi:hypothetical protein ATANTOWER_030040 [Ataeniobius toweri]|uniref:Uncharacterized protein n=1 Tax=Ataeniobius toweri TaxID=208326 RepID=A0ABU7BSG0_9TELE|nr:hypothetical protein [Ataeniobius toweri]